MPQREVIILSIHDREPQRPVLDFDLKDILDALGEYAARWTFCVLSLDASGEAAGQLCDEVESAGGKGLCLPADELRSRLASIEQTISAEILAFPKDLDPAAISAADLDLARFPESRAEAAIVAVDSSYFEVYTKDPAVADAIRRAFRDVRSHDPEPYFLTPPSR